MPPRAIYEASRPVELVLEGENLTPDTLKLYHNGVLYTPLESSDTYAYYLLGDNGTNKVMLNGKNFCTIIVKDIVVPEGLPNRLEGLLYASSSDTSNRMILQTASCLQYPYKVSEAYPYFLLTIGKNSSPFTDDDANNYTFVNCTMETMNVYQETSIRTRVSVVDSTKPAYITYQGFIIAVFNYTA